MVMLSDLHPSSFRGVGFLTPQDSGTFGRKNIEHNYPDSNHHYLEDNGGLPEKFNITAILHGKSAKSDFLALKAALTQPGPGTLIHPWLGAQFVKAGEVNFTRDQKVSGEISLTIPFTITGESSFPGIQSGVASIITSLASGAVANIFADFSKSFTAPVSAASNLLIGANVSSVFSQIKSSFPDASDVISITRQFESYGSTIMQDPSRFGDMLQGIFRAPFDSDIVSNLDLHKQWPVIFDKVSEISVPIKTAIETFDQLNRRENLDILKSSLQLSSVMSVAEGISLKEYFTADEIVIDRKLLSDMYSKALN